MEINLYPDQTDLFDKCSNEFRRGKRRVLLTAPCGSGKSYLFLYMCTRTIQSGKSVLILVHRKELAEQHKQLFRDHGISSDRIRIALFWSESRHLGEYPTPDLIIADEAHWIPDSFRKVVDFYKCRVIGLTATPCRLTGQPMGAVYDSLVVGISVAELIEQKRLAPYEYYSVTLADVHDLRISHGEYNLTDAEQLLMQSKVFGDAIKSYEKFAKGKKTIVYCTTKKHSKRVAEEFRKAGYAAEHLDSDTPAKRRAKIMQDFRSGKAQIICNVMLIVEGISVNDCECCMLLRPTLSTTVFIQSAMRCMRYQPGKTAIIIDCVANYKKLGFPATDREWCLDAPIKNQRSEFNDDGTLRIRECKNCFRVFGTLPKCPYCGTPYETTPREIEQIKNVELSRIREKEAEEEARQRKSARMEIGMCRTYADLLKIERERGYKHGWAYIMAKKKRIIE